MSGDIRRRINPLSTPQSSQLALSVPQPSHLATTTTTETGAPCRWLHHQPPQHDYSVLDDQMEDFALMASLVSATNSTSNCDDALLKGP